MKHLIITIIALLIVVGSSAQNPKFQALFIYNFAKNVEWPPAYRQGNFTIAIVGNYPQLYTELQQIAMKKKVEDQNIEIESFSSVSQIERCHILYIPRSRSSWLDDVNEKISNQPVLTITDKAGLRGACINFIDNDFDLDFEISTQQIEKHRLKISEQLLNLGTVID